MTPELKAELAKLSLPLTVRKQRAHAEVFGADGVLVFRSIHDRGEAALITIAVNHFERLVMWLDALSNEDAQSTMDAGTTLQAQEAQQLLAEITAAARENKP